MGQLFLTFFTQVLPQQTKHEAYAHNAEIEYKSVPHSVYLKEGIMTPQQRRERLDFEVKHQNAKVALQRAELKERRFEQLMYRGLATSI